MSMNMSDYMQPKWFLSTKRGVGMVMAAAGTLVPVVAVYFGVSLDAAAFGDFAATLSQWFDVTWNAIAYGLWIWGSFRPSAPMTVTKPV